jgi:hypothetical protein
VTVAFVEYMLVVDLMVVYPVRLWVGVLVPPDLLDHLDLLEMEVFLVMVEKI